MDCRSSITPRDLERMICDEAAEPKALPLSLLEEITGGFSDEQRIGSGAFAEVYKGNLENRTVAVKRMTNTYMYEKEFHREVQCLMMVKHTNVVQFLGYCADTQGSVEKYDGKFVMADVQQRLLCFEYLPGGSLHEYITDTSSGLQWRDRYHIIKGVCQGLHYLHQKNIVHLDLKPANILLDDNLVAKLADFGLSRCFDVMQSRVHTANIGGSLGYLAPEFSNGDITYKFDIYSLGVIIIEILTGKKGYHDVDKVVESWSSRLEKSQIEVQLEQVRVCAELGIECTNFNPEKRPDTQHIINRIDELESMGDYNDTEEITSQEISPNMFIGAMHSLSLSYQHLNSDIKRCFEYCGIFPRRFKLRKEELVRLWIAQGFVKTSCATEDMEDVAGGYIQELVSRSFLLPEGTSSDNACFTIHDMLHDLLDSVCRNCFKVENAKSKRGGEWEGDVPRDVQHLFIQIYDAKLITEKILRLENLRTLIIYVVEEDTPVEEKVIESILKGLPKLRVLAIALSQENDPIKQADKFSIPESICQLKHLRYFAFRTDVSCTLILPKALNTLHHVQLLDFGDGNIVDFNFGNHINLRHISCKTYMNFANIGRLTSLQTLSGFKIRNEPGYEIKQLRDLNKLRGGLAISGLVNVKSKEEALEANLGAKEGLTELTLLWNLGDTSYISPEVETKVLDGLCPPVGLQELYIWYFEGLRYPNWMVGKHNSGPTDLQTLAVWGCTQLGPQLPKAFPHLQSLSIWYCEWKVLPGNMESLTSLNKMVIGGCLNIQSLPTLPQSLEEFTVLKCNDEFMESCQTVGHPNWQKIEHIPNKTFI